ncbi:uncharacterized protein LOC133799903 [Humulus lupulus]|uniref:uncharacterized protein LOC133799903 n=1 Tax=Humulus lupulus TaxID=3486 RepID=UPI002B40B381|nr:uncharacterized protein LOC133799903 [Humulus lupulus]
MEILEKKQVEEFLVLCWRIWYRRNQFVHDNKLLDDGMVGPWALNFLWHYQEAQNQTRTEEGGGGSSTHPTVAQVVPLADGEMCVHVDAGLDGDKGMVGIGAVVVDSLGFVHCSAATPLTASLAPHVAEAAAALEGMLLCIRLGFLRIRISTDCLRVCQSIAHKEANNSEYGIVLQDIYQAWSSFSSISIGHCNRASNSTAHSLAKLALSLDSPRVWCPGLPSCLWP